jgi:hypothetical protein
VTLRFDATRWRTGTVTGTEQVVFVPDRRVCELVFRLWANKPETVQGGSWTSVRAATVDGRAVAPRAQPAGGTASRPTLVELPLPGCRAAGSRITARLDFTLVLGPDISERVGRSTTRPVAWFATAFPLLAWEHGVGWMRDPAVDLLGEMAGSEVFALDSLDVVAAAGDSVAGTGARTAVTPAPARASTHRFVAPAVRDVAVSVGAFAVVERQVAGVRVHVATAGATVAPGAVWADDTEKALEELTALLGPFPYSDLWVTIIPGLGGGIEFPSAIYLGDIVPASFAALVPHEVAHSWFYGLVGNNQGRDPWLDEAFATWAEAVVEDSGDSYRPQSPPGSAGRLGAPMTYWAQRPSASYLDGVYVRGARALLDAREAVGPDRFDAAVRAYVAANAHQVATPEDVEEAFRELPEVLRILRAAGAFSAGGAVGGGTI